MNAAWSGMQVVAVGEALDGRDVEAVLRDGEQQAGVRAAAVDEHGARAALAVVAALLRPGEPELLAQHVEERRARVDLDPVVGFVDAEGDVGVMGHTRHSRQAPSPAKRKRSSGRGAGVA